MKAPLESTAPGGGGTGNPPWVQEVFQNEFGMKGQIRVHQPLEWNQVVFFHIALICTTSRWIPASASQIKGTGKGDVMLLEGLVEGRDVSTMVD